MAGAATTVGSLIVCFLSQLGFLALFGRPPTSPVSSPAPATFAEDCPVCATSGVPGWSNGHIIAAWILGCLTGVGASVAVVAIGGGLLSVCAQIAAALFGVRLATSEGVIDEDLVLYNGTGGEERREPSVSSRAPADQDCW